MLVFQLCFVLFLYSLFRVFQQYLAPVAVQVQAVFSCPTPPVPLSELSVLPLSSKSCQHFFCGLLFHCVTPSLSVVNIFTEHPDVVHISSSEHFVSELSLFCGAENAALSLNKTVSVLSVGSF